MRRRRALSIAAAFCALSPGAASADPCAPIAAAFEKLAAAPAYRQLTRPFGKKSSTSLAVGQKFYVQNDGQWQALSLKPGERLAMMKAAVGAGMRDCVEEKAETFDGASVKAYSYSPSAELEAQGAGSQTIWVGADGLPRRLFSPTVEVEFSYDDVKAPPNATEAPRPQ